MAPALWPCLPYFTDTGKGCEEAGSCKRCFVKTDAGVCVCFYYSVKETPTDLLFTSTHMNYSHVILSYSRPDFEKEILFFSAYIFSNTDDTTLFLALHAPVL